MVTDAEMDERARGPHHETHRLCSIVNAASFPVGTEAETPVGGLSDGVGSAGGARTVGDGMRRLAGA